MSSKDLPIGCKYLNFFFKPVSRQEIVFSFFVLRVQSC